MDRIRRDTLLGIVFFGTLAFLLWATVNLTDLSLGKIPPLVVYFPDAGSAEAGTNVMVLGKKVGKVGSIDVLYERPEYPVRMTLLLKEAVPLTDKALIEVRDAGVLGGKMIYIDPGRGARLPEGNELHGQSLKGAFDRIGDIADGRGELGRNLTEALVSFRTFFDNMNNEESTVGRLVRRRELYDEVLETVQKLNGIFEAVQKGDGLIGRLVVDRTMRDDAMKVITNLAAVSDALRGTEGTAGLLLNDRGLAESIRTTFASIANVVADVNSGKGTIGRLVRDEQLASDLGASMANLSTLLQKANDPDAGAIGALTSDKQVATDLKLIIANLRQVTDQLTQSEGALGILLNDKDLGVRLKRIFTQVSRALEDARESAPIGNFVQVLLGAF
ncbi:MAG TPA: MlaD family protein [Planctomycetota bacterium]|nr:MlaD family protein [Planctomycetota bacterium]